MAYRRFTFRVALAERPDDPALLMLDDQQTLADLHYAIQFAFGWDSDHLYSFFMSGKAWDQSSEYAAMVEGGSAAKPARRARLGQLGLEVGAKFLYLFDYGDERRFDVRVEKIAQSNFRLRQAETVRAPAEVPRQYEDDEDDEDDEAGYGAPIEPIEAALAAIGQSDPAEIVPKGEMEYEWGGDGSNLHEPIRAHVEAALVPTDAAYPPPVDQLLNLGDARDWEAAGARIAALGLTQEHLPDLVRMIRDRALNTAMGDSDVVWAPIHALHALEQLDVSGVVDDLLPLFDVDTDWFGEGLPDVLSNAGAAALEPLRQYLQDRTRWIYGRANAARAISDIGKRYTDLRERAVRIIADELDHAAENDPTLNGFLLSNVLDLAAVEALPSVRRAFEQNLIDESIAGDWREVQEAMGLTPDPDDPLVQRSLQRRSTQRLGKFPASPAFPGEPGDRPLFPPKRSSSAKKAKRKMSGSSRKANKSKKKKRR